VVKLKKVSVAVARWRRAKSVARWVHKVCAGRAQQLQHETTRGRGGDNGNARRVRRKIKRSCLLPVINCRKGPFIKRHKRPNRRAHLRGKMRTSEKSGDSATTATYFKTRKNTTGANGTPSDREFHAES
jgi:hypothetical protein